MAVVTAIPEKNLWDEICKELAHTQPPFPDDDNISVATAREEYDATKHTPVFFGDTMHKRVSVDQLVDSEFDASVSHPACVGFAFVSRPEEWLPCAQMIPPDKNTCSPREYLEWYVFPTLLPALEELLKRADSERCFERKRTKFCATDFLTEYLYKNNPLHCGRQCITLPDIPFVQEWWKLHPRIPLPKSVYWTEEESVLIIQAFWQGYKVRCEPGVQELRQWQREWRTESSGFPTLSVGCADSEQQSTYGANDGFASTCYDSARQPSIEATCAGFDDGTQQPPAEASDATCGPGVDAVQSPVASTDAVASAGCGEEMQQLPAAGTCDAPGDLGCDPNATCPQNEMY